MQRDMKVGMALGVALVGIVGALFFRRDPAPKDPAPPLLQGAAELDRQIAEKPKGPYIQGLDEFAEPAPASPPAQTANPGTAPRPDAYELPGFLTREDEAEHRVVAAAKAAATPDPIATTPLRETRPREAGIVPQPPPAHNRDWEPAGAPSAAASGPAKATAGNAQPAPARRTHLTQPGETLSGLAAHYLGSSARYREIYEANRNVLKSPDDIPDGVTLVIPEGRNSTAPPATTNHNHTAESSAPPKVRRASTQSHLSPPAPDVRAPVDRASAVSGEVHPGKLRFAPVTRGPFSAGRTTSGARAVPTPTAPSSRTESKPAPPRIDFEAEDPF